MSQAFGEATAGLHIRRIYPARREHPHDQGWQGCLERLEGLLEQSE